MQLSQIKPWIQSLPERLKEAKRTAWAIAAGSLLCLLVGFWRDSAALVGVGGALLCYLFMRMRGWKPPVAKHLAQSEEEAAPLSPTPVAASAPPSDTGELIEQMLAQGRYALLLRPGLVENLTSIQFEQARAALEESMSLVPEGELAVGWSGDSSSRDVDPFGEAQAIKIVQIERLYLDRHPISNREYLEFVAAGGYEELALWEPEIWPGILDFVDQTEHPGPAYWKNGRYEVGLDDHPVVGICWFEASAFARWVGKRIPSGPEWEKAGSWPVQLSAGNRPQRKYPWGDFMDRARANVWSGSKAGTVSVFDFPEGASVGGVFQLIGNVWEWTTGNFGGLPGHGGDVVLSTPMKALRGGAFDTYFDGHATCQFQSGEDPVRRKHNIGFRCALSVCDLALDGRRTDPQSATMPDVGTDLDVNVPAVEGNVAQAIASV